MGGNCSETAEDAKNVADGAVEKELSNPPADDSEIFPIADSLLLFDTLEFVENEGVKFPCGFVKTVAVGCDKNTPLEATGGPIRLLLRWRCIPGQTM